MRVQQPEARGMPLQSLHPAIARQLYPESSSANAILPEDFGYSQPQGQPEFPLYQVMM